MLNGLNLNQWTWLITFINLIVFYLLMKKFLFKRVTQFMDNRTKSIKDSIDNAEKSKVEAAELKTQYAEKLHSAKEEADNILNEARSRAGKEYEEIVANARIEAENILAKAREEIDREKEELLKDVKSQVAGLALAAASKVLEANMDTESNRKLVDKFIGEVGAA
ncbi:MAG TPA: F0F1 ATP synthase subunit B [Clostridia bacterium]|nr:F0F1 ATP synthase subunit B [Clostridia bacterium]